MSALAIHPSPTARKIHDRRRRGAGCAHYGLRSLACAPAEFRSAAAPSGMRGGSGPVLPPSPTALSTGTTAPLREFSRGDVSKPPAKGAPVVVLPDLPARADQHIAHAGARVARSRGSEMTTNASRPEAVRMRLTARGRRVVVALGFALAIALGGGVGALAQQQDSAPAHVETVVVQPGESLWAIAVGVSGPDEDVRDVVEQIRNLNGLHGATLQAGQELTIPVQ